MQVRVGRYLAALAVAGTLGVGILIGTLIAHHAGDARASSTVAPDARPLPAPSPVDLSNSFAKIAANVGPAVVNIKTKSTIRITRRQFPQGTPFDDFFDRFFHGAPGEHPPGDLPESSLGSGVILDKAGYILTNYHVVMREDDDRPVDHMNVYFSGDGDDEPGNGYPARIIGTDKLTDLAVIKVDAGRPLPTAALGDSDAARVGDWVLAIGSPFGLNSTVTAGIISAKGRVLQGTREEEFKRFLQTDAAINPGNSGGPLVNLASQVIGINTAIATDRGAYEGVGLAIPSNTARRVYNAIISTGQVRRGAIGVSFTPGNNSVLLKSFGADHGVVVDQVETGSPAERAGLQRGDVITTIDSKPVKNGEALLAMVSESDPGTRLRIEFLRDGKLRSTEVVVGDWNKIVGQGASGSANAGHEPQVQPATGALGISVKPLAPEQAQDVYQQLHLATPQGVLITEVRPGSFADDLGLVRSDIVLSINHQVVKSVDDYNRLQSRLKSGDDVVILIARRNQGTYSTLFLADRMP